MTQIQEPPALVDSADMTDRALAVWVLGSTALVVGRGQRHLGLLDGRFLGRAGRSSAASA